MAKKKSLVKRRRKYGRGIFRRGLDGLVDTIRPGCRVTIVTPQYQQRSGRAVMRGPHGWVLNMGGKHGTPAVATDKNIIMVRCASPMMKRK